jgi:glycosyltransferase involved in cell wall biosynthesis
VLLPMADAVSYISDEDVSADAERVRRLPASYVVPNGIHPQLSASELEAPPEDGYLAWLADWIYPPNQESLRWFVREVAPLLPDDALARVRLFGHGEPWATVDADEDSARAAAVMGRGGFVEELADVYRGARAVVAPVTRGAGMNNKVLEPLAAGRDLLTTPVGVRGLSDAVRGGVRLAEDGPAFARELEEMLNAPWDRARAERARESVSAMSWERSGREMDAAVREVAARGRQRGALIR